MPSDRTILIIGTFDTKEDELSFVAACIRNQGGGVLTMDVSVLGEASRPAGISKHAVAEAGGSSIEAIIAQGDENHAMQVMAGGASALASRLHGEGRFDGVIVLGGTMGTDLALDVCNALPLGVPKYVVSTISFSPMIPPGRLAADIQMILWAGGLYGLNPICKASLSQAAGAVLGAARAVERPVSRRPMIGMTSFGKTVLRYMVHLKPELERRGFDVAVFHATGMGGRAFESLAAQGAFAAVMDFAPQEVGNHLFGSAITAGEDRMTHAGRRGIPQMISIGCHDLVDLVGWQPMPERFADRPAHAHNRLLTSVLLNGPERELLAETICSRLARARGPVTMLLPMRGGNEWDREGAPLADPEALNRFLDAVRANCPGNAELVEIDCHINDPEFSERALAILDRWMGEGLVAVS